MVDITVGCLFLQSQGLLHNLGDMLTIHLMNLMLGDHRPWLSSFRLLDLSYYMPVGFAQRLGPSQDCLCCHRPMFARSPYIRASKCCTAYQMLKHQNKYHPTNKFKTHHFDGLNPSHNLQTILTQSINQDVLHHSFSNKSMIPRKLRKRTDQSIQRFLICTPTQRYKIYQRAAQCCIIALLPVKILAP